MQRIGVMGWVLAFDLVLLTSLQSGCSFLAVTAPPEDRGRAPYVDCTTENYAPAFDVAAAIASAASAMVASVAAGTDEATTAHGIAIGAGIVGAVVHGLSAHHGYSTTEACRAVRGETAARANEDLIAAIRDGRAERSNHGASLALDAQAVGSGAVSSKRTEEGEEFLLNIVVEGRRMVAKTVSVAGAPVTFGYRVSIPLEGQRCDLRVAADGQAVVIAEQRSSTQGEYLNLWGSVDLEAFARLASARRVTVRGCDEQVTLGAAEHASLGAFVVRVREARALQAQDLSPSAEPPSSATPGTPASGEREPSAHEP